MLARAEPEAPSSVAFTKNEITLLDRPVSDAGNRRAKHGTLSFYLIKLARLGGYLARACDSPPGSIVTWRGLARLTDIDIGADAGGTHLWVIERSAGRLHRTPAIYPARYPARSSKQSSPLPKSPRQAAKSLSRLLTGHENPRRPLTLIASADREKLDRPRRTRPASTFCSALFLVPLTVLSQIKAVGSRDCLCSSHSRFLRRERRALIPDYCR